MCTGVIMLNRFALYLIILPLLSSCMFVELSTPQDFNFKVGENIQFVGKTSAGVSQVVVSTSFGDQTVEVADESFQFNLSFDQEVSSDSLKIVAIARGREVAEMTYRYSVASDDMGLPNGMGTFGFKAPSSDDRIKDLTLWATYYYLQIADAVEDGVAVRDLAGNPLGPEVTRKDWCLGALEGSMLVWEDGRATTYNYAGVSNDFTVDCSAYFDHTPSHRVKFRLANNPFGDGVRNYPLIPYRTIAVDPNVIPYGTVLYIPDARGVELELPDGSVVTHDGYFFAGDTGGLIKQTHIDVFYGVSRKNPFSFVKSRESGIFQAYIVEHGHDASIFLESIH